MKLEVRELEVLELEVLELKLEVPCWRRPRCSELKLEVLELEVLVLEVLEISGGVELGFLPVKRPRARALLDVLELEVLELEVLELELLKLEGVQGAKDTVSNTLCQNNPGNIVTNQHCEKPTLPHIKQHVPSFQLETA